MGLRFVHCSDVHQLHLRGSWPHQFFNKRVTGGLNILFNRRRKYRGRLFLRMLEQIVDPELRVQRLVITGDLTNLALSSEMRHIAGVLGDLPLPVTVIPGNHDAYTRGAHRGGKFEEHLGRFMAGEREPGHDYPFVHRAGRVALIGASSAIASAPGYAIGRLGDDQLERLDRALEAHADAFRVLLVHHPLVDEHTRPARRMTDADALCAVLARRGAELVLHGHEHRQFDYAVPGPAGEIPVHAISSTISVARDGPKQAAFAIYDVRREGTWARELWRWDGDAFAPEGEQAE